MSKFNTTRTPRVRKSPVQTAAVATGTTYQGAPGFERDPKGELFLLAVTNMVDENTFYEKAGARDARFENLVGVVAVQDPDWIMRFLAWLRAEANMRSASLVGALEAASVLAAAGVPGSRKMVAAVLQRGDEPGEALAYWLNKYGRKIPKPIKRGIADAARRLYTERNLLKYDTASHSVRFGDVLELTHPSPSAPWQADLFKHAIDRRQGRDGLEIPDSLEMVARNAQVRREAEGEDWLDAGTLKGAGMTWEDVLSSQGSKTEKKALWESVIPTMGLMALARNLRNFDEAGVSDEVAQKVIDRFVDPEQVAKSRMFPFRWLAAYREAPSLRWAHALDKALTASLLNVPSLKGSSLILIDTSGSMVSPAGGRLSKMSRSDVAKVFGVSLAMRAESATVVNYSDTFKVEKIMKGGSLLKNVENIRDIGSGTYTAQVVAQNYRGHDRVVILTDEQAHPHIYNNVSSQVPANIPVYTWNLAGYKLGSTAGGPNRHTFGGLSDNAFKLIPLLEAAGEANWPF